MNILAHFGSNMSPVFHFSDPGFDWQGLNTFLSANSLMVFLLIFVVAGLVFFALLFPFLAYQERQYRLRAVARAGVDEKEQEVKLLELQLIREDKLPASVYTSVVADESSELEDQPE